MGHLPGASARQRPKTLLTAVIPWGLSRVFFPSKGRTEGNSQFGIILEKNMNYLSVTSRLAWRGPRMAPCGGPDSTPGKQVWAAAAQPDPQSCEQAGCPAVPILHGEPARPLPGQGKELAGGLSQRPKVPKISLSMCVPPPPLH